MSDVRQSPQWASFMALLGWETVNLSPGKAYLKKVPFLGFLVKVPKITPSFNLQKLDQLAISRKILFTKVEPDSPAGNSKLAASLTRAGFKNERWSLQPTKTLMIDLKGSPEKILSRMEKDTRYSIRAAEKRGVHVKETSDLEVFWKLYEQTSKRGGFWIARKELETLWRVFHKDNKASLLVAYYNNKPLAASFLLFHEKTGYYYHAASSDKRRDLFATYLVVWRSILEAKKRGCRSFDLLGIVDPRIPSTRSWQGFSHFKRGFGGKELTYLGSFIKVYNPILKPIFFFNRFF